MNNILAYQRILTVISIGITFHETIPCYLSIQYKSQASLTLYNDYKMDKPYKITLPRGVSSPVTLLQILKGVLIFSNSSLSSSSYPHHLTCNFLTPLYQRPPLNFYAKACTVLLTGIGRTLIPGQHTHLYHLDQPWHYNCRKTILVKDDSSDEAPLSWIKLSAPFSLSCILLYSGVSYILYFVCQQRKSKFFMQGQLTKINQTISEPPTQHLLDWDNIQFILHALCRRRRIFV